MGGLPAKTFAGVRFLAADNWFKAFSACKI
jgi:hypothetical protein